MIKIANTSELQNGQSKKFTFQRDGQTIDAFLIRYNDQFFAYENKCKHLALSLDLEDNDFFSVSGKTLICKAHGAEYLPDSGQCVAGPCEPRSKLNSIQLVISGMDIMANRD